MSFSFTTHSLRFVLLTASLAAARPAYAVGPADASKHHPTCKQVAANSCIDSPGSFAPPVTGSATLSVPVQSSTFATSLAATAATASSGGLVYYVDTYQTVH